MTVPIDALRGLEATDDAELGNVVLYGNGSEIHWPGLDYQIEITVLLARLLGVTTVGETATAG